MLLYACERPCDAADALYKGSRRWVSWIPVPIEVFHVIEVTQKRMNQVIKGQEDMLYKMLVEKICVL